MSPSVTSNHFPQIVWREGEKCLWNPIHRQALKNLPEERVRLGVLEYLLHEGWSKHRISTEEAIDLPRREVKHRTDLICYNADFTPFLLVECKAENVTLTEQTADQIARYNQKVSAPYLLMTNGRQDFWYRINEAKSIKLLEQLPDLLPQKSSPKTDFNYWTARGLAGSGANPDLRLWLNKALKSHYIEPGSQSRRYLSFKSNPTDMDLRNYYGIYSVDQSKVAIGFSGTEFGGNRLVGIFNRNGKNEALLEINLDLLFDERAPNASVYWAGGARDLDIRSQITGFTRAHFSNQKAAEQIHALFVSVIT